MVATSKMHVTHSHSIGRVLVQVQVQERENNGTPAICRCALFGDFLKRNIPSLCCKIPGTSSDNSIRFVEPTKPHTATIGLFMEADRT